MYLTLLVLFSTSEHLLRGRELVFIPKDRQGLLLGAFNHLLGNPPALHLQAPYFNFTLFPYLFPISFDLFYGLVEAVRSEIKIHIAFPIVVFIAVL